MGGVAKIASERLNVVKNIFCLIMVLSAHLYRIKTENFPKVASILLQEGEYKFGEFKDTGQSKSLRLIVKKIKDTAVGKFVEGFIDTLYVRSSFVYEDGILEPTTQKFRETSPIFYQLYNEIHGSGYISNVLVVFSSAYLANEFDNAVRDIIGNDMGSPKILINIDSSNEENITREFDDVKRISITDMDDDRLKSMGLGGRSRVFESDEWRKGFHEYGGTAAYIGVQINGIWFYLSHRGTIIIRQGMEIEPFARYFIPEILKRLIRSKAVLPV
jgi:hypothetical protein